MDCLEKANVLQPVVSHAVAATTHMKTKEGERKFLLHDV
jgi:hypothetical protein